MTTVAEWVEIRAELAETITLYSHHRAALLRLVDAHLANQSGSERAGVDRAKLAEWADDFEAAAHEVPRGIKSTILMTRAQEVREALATPPAQPAPAATHGKPDGAVREELGWHPLSEELSWLDGRDVVLLAHGMEVSARYCAGEWSDETPDHPREYDGAVWSCFDDQFQIEIEECAKDPREWSHNGATHWREPAALHSRTAETSPGDVLDVLRSIRAMCDEPLSYGRSNLADRIAAAIDRIDVKAEAKSQEPEAVAVKPLEWYEEPLRSPDQPAWNADSPVGAYRVFKAWWGKENKDGWIGNGEFHHTEAAAKAAAQADYEERVRSALIRPTTKPEAPAISLNGVTQVVYDHGPSFSWDECKKIAGSLLARFHITDRDARS